MSCILRIYYRVSSCWLATSTQPSVGCILPGLAINNVIVGGLSNIHCTDKFERIYVHSDLPTQILVISWLISGSFCSFMNTTVYVLQIRCQVIYPVNIECNMAS